MSSSAKFIYSSGALKPRLCKDHDVLEESPCVSCGGVLRLLLRTPGASLLTCSHYLRCRHRAQRRRLLCMSVKYAGGTTRFYARALNPDATQHYAQHVQALIMDNCIETPQATAELWCVNMPHRPINFTFARTAVSVCAVRHTTMTAFSLLAWSEKGMRRLGYLSPALPHSIEANDCEPKVT